jgi:ABC-type uncharacterized transport system substrate-binding protein
MKRREFVTLLGGAAVAWPLAVRAQQRPIPVIGFLSGATFEMMRGYVAAFHRGLADAGFSEGRNVSIEYRWAEGHNDRLPALATDLVRREVTIIVVGGSTPGALAAKAATQTVPIVFLVGPDPIKLGLVASFNRPGGNITGITILNVELIAKCFELMHSLIPNFFLTQRDRLVELAANHAVPTIYAYREYAVAGGLVSYGTDISDAYRLVGINTGRILKGEKAADLPVQQVTKVELILNLKTAKALGLTFPLTLLGRADEVIE